MRYQRTSTDQRGVVILIGVIILSIVLLLLATSVNLLTSSTYRSSSTYDYSLISGSYADSCLNEALLRLRRNSGYTGGTLTLNALTCRVNVTSTGGTGRVILAEGEYNGVREGVEAAVTVTGSVTRTSWSRCPSGGNARMEAGTIAGVTDSWTHVAFRQCYLNPVVKTLHFESSSTLANAPRVRNVTSSGFDVRLQNAANTAVTAETLSYLVVEEGAFTLSDGTKVEAHRFATSTVGYAPSSWSSDAVTYTNAYASAPVVLAQVMSSFDDTFVATWINGGTQTTPPTNTVARIGLNLAQTGTAHSVETIGWIAMTSGISSTIGSAAVPYKTFISGNAVTGHDNGCSTVNYAAAFSTNPILVANQVGMNDGDGGWLVQCAQSTSAARVHVEEDQVADAERSHAAEKMNGIAFQSAFVLSQ